jgi:hypothetical protein
MGAKPRALQFYCAYCLDDKGRIPGPAEEIWAESGEEAILVIKDTEGPCSKGRALAATTLHCAGWTVGAAGALIRLFQLRSWKAGVPLALGHSLHRAETICRFQKRRGLSQIDPTG